MHGAANRHILWQFQFIKGGNTVFCVVLFAELFADATFVKLLKVLLLRGLAARNRHRANKIVAQAATRVFVCPKRLFITISGRVWSEKMENACFVLR